MDRELAVSPWPEWEIVEKIGEGSFGKVYKAKRSVQGHTFYSAIKIISIPDSKEEMNSIMAEMSNPDSARTYFETMMQECISEVSMMELFRGTSNIVSVEDFKVIEYLDEIGWDIYIRMEYLTTFLDHCMGKTLEEKEVIRIGTDLARALTYCESLNILHRDVKPENIFVTRFGDFKLGDFGIAKKIEETRGAFSKKGTFSYMAPEVYRGEACTAQSDLYSLGIVLYKLMNRNRLPFVNLEKQLITYHDKETALNKRLSGEEMPEPAEASDSFAGIILKACAYLPEERYQKAEDLYQDLLELSQKKEVSSKKTLKEKREEHALRANARKKQQEAEKSNNSFQQSAPWIIAIIVVAAVAVVSSAVFMKMMLEDAVNSQAKIMVASLDTSTKETTEEKSGSDFTSSIKLISDRVTTIVEETPNYEAIGTEGNCIRYINEEGEIAKVLVYPAVSGEGVYEEYYYWNEVLIFAYIWEENGPVNMYYYQDGMLIRWIENDGTVHDNEVDNDEFNERGDRYWINSIADLKPEAVPVE